jgi:hypothetical protein
MIAIQRRTVALLAFSLVGLTDCHKTGAGTAAVTPNIKLDGPAMATMLLTGDGWGEYAPCG